MSNFSWTRQNVVALSAWTAYSPSWDSSQRGSNTVLNKNAPPMWEGARLGGFTRMRAYDMNRFSDQKWSSVPIDWFKMVLFAEAGRVASEYNLVTLIKDLKYDVGFSLRALAANLPVHFLMEFGDEGSNM